VAGRAGRGRAIGHRDGSSGDRRGASERGAWGCAAAVPGNPGRASGHVLEEAVGVSGGLLGTGWAR
jgi:hypothetical protein